MSIEKAEGVRGKWACRDGRMVSISEHEAIKPFYINGKKLDDFENPITGQIEDNIPSYERRLKEKGYFVKGNDRLQYKLPSFDERYMEIRKAAQEAERQIKWGMAKSTSEEREVWERQTRESKK